MITNRIKKFHVISAIVIMLLGTLLHFTYDISNKNTFVALFSAINESTWEHLKLLFFPALLTIIIGYFIVGKNTPNFVCSKTIGLLISMAFIITFFYTYSGIVGKTIPILDILSYYISVIIGESISYNLMKKKYSCNNKISILILTMLALCFIFFTFNPPKIVLFKDPINGGYGISSRLYN